MHPMPISPFKLLHSFVLVSSASVSRLLLAKKNVVCTCIPHHVRCDYPPHGFAGATLREAEQMAIRHCV